MYLRKDEANELLQEHLKRFVSNLQDSHSFLNELLGGDDWSFVIKAQALIEGSVTQAIMAQIGDERIKKIIEIMPLVGEEVSKLALAKSLGILSSEQRRFVKKMASLRNNLAHRVENVGFKFEAHVASLEKSGRQDWQDSIVWFPNTPESREVWCRIATEHAKTAIYLATIMLVGLLEIDGSEKDFSRKISAAAEATTKELLETLNIPKNV